MAAEAPPATRLDRWLALDRRYSAKLRFAEKPGPLRRLAILLAHSGDSWYLGPALLLAAWLGGQPAQWLVARLLIAIGVLVVIIFLVKRRFKRQRPQGEWGAFYRKTDPHSFPSGHAARMAMLAVLAFGLAPAWLGLVMLVWAPAVSLSRVAMGVHYLSDVIVGAAIGIAVGLILLGIFAVVRI
ncbi:MAG: phosphatase PAP2 family protein [Anaerolineales bacterium]